jgi:hypothetical protein
MIFRIARQLKDKPLRGRCAILDLPHDPAKSL